MSFYTGLTGLKAATTDLDTTSHNIANASTTGFKNSRAEFGDLVDSNAPMGGGLGVKTQAVNQLFGQGGIITTGNSTGSKLDLAITGNGFFQVKDPNTEGAVYTRAGSFYVDVDGYIVNNIGQRLQDGSGPPGTDLQFTGTMPVDNITIDKATGDINARDATGAPVTAGAPLNLVNFPNVQGLKQISDTSWLETTASGAPTFGLPGSGNLGTLMSGALENSNVDLTEQLVNMIVAQRNFQANSKTITVNNTLTETVTNMIR
ncbi:MAG TPA: flagellar hook basal-body protein [Candidatus Competibacteraceae bacterium]|nr:flagellar hook basal-body protein [Candidatus Competibacteraceae bacterium]MCP5132245.1 flagellar hook basal-body protein [Gammaproteobacteria bacterium]HPF59203.1 flagellar hook basal-body protein [Candidatus Competibacteraceae bacterium]HRY17661.1 flagellar hook basal-body protein [Candidatus Competibacteraceae bacterium]